MIELDLINQMKSGPLRILCIGAHCDDIEIGCGGTLLELQRKRKDMTVQWVILSSNEKRADEAEKSAARFLRGARDYSLIKGVFKDGYFPYLGSGIKDFFEELKKEAAPDLVFTHYRSDFHQDHRIVSELTWNTFRNHLILEYEIPKYDGDMGSPNLYFQLDKETCSEKIDIIKSSYKTQEKKQWFDEETFWSLLRLRGMEANSKYKYAEGFYCRKIVF